MEETKTSRWLSEDYMKRAFELAQGSARSGFVIVHDDVIVGEGATLEATLAKAGDRARGATLYTPIEPDAAPLLQAGLKKIVASLADPKEGGKQMALCTEAGIETHLGLLERHAEKALAPYLHFQRTGLPYVVLRLGMSIDGRIGDPLSEEARHDAQQLRADASALLIGSETAIQDKPKLTVKGPEKPPLRVLLDGRGRVKQSKHLFDTALAPTLVYTTTKAEEESFINWNKQGIEAVKVIPAMSGVGLHLPEVLMDLGKRGISQVLVEGGGSVASSFLAGGHVQRLIVYTGSTLLGTGARPAFDQKLDDPQKWKLEEVKQLGETVRLRYEKVSL